MIETITISDHLTISLSRRILVYVFHVPLSRCHMFFGSVGRVLRITRVIPALGSESLNKTFNCILITIVLSLKVQYHKIIGVRAF